MNKNQIICWHYVLDIHDPESVWYSDHKVMGENLSVCGLYDGSIIKVEIK